MSRLALGLLAVLALLLSGCGGGGSRSNRPPQAQAGPDLESFEGDRVEMDGRGSSDPDGPIATFRWTQTAGPPVTLDDPSAPVTGFSAPEVRLGGEEMAFRLDVVDPALATSTDSVQIRVRNRAAAPARARYVILLVGDGMARAHQIATSRYLTGSDAGLTWDGFPERAPCTTWDVTTYDRFAWSAGSDRFDPFAFDPRVGYDPVAGGAQSYDTVWAPPSDSYFLSGLPVWGGGDVAKPATDSASAATALATGRKTDKGNLSWSAGDPADGALVTLTDALRTDRQAAVGFVTTVEFTHATPAAFFSHNVNRRNYGAISTEICTVTRPDVVIGAGHPDGVGSFKYVNREDYEGLRDGTTPYDAYRFVERRAGIDGEPALRAAADEAIAGGTRLFGLFGGESMEHAPPTDTPGAPSVAFESEGLENPGLAPATLAALRVLEHRGGTHGFFLLVEGGDIDWANHDNDFAWMIGAAWNFDRAVAQVIAYVDDPGNGLDWDNTLVVVTADHANSYMRLPVALGAGDLPRQEKVGGDWTYPDGDVTYSTGGHTNEPVMIHARGAGAELLRDYVGAWYPGTGLVDNTHVYLVLARALGLE